MLQGRVEQKAITEQGVLEQIAALPMDKQAQVIGAGIQAYSQEANHQQFRIMVGAIAGFGDGMVGLAQGAESLGNAVLGIAQFGKEVIANDPAAVDKVGKAGEAFGTLLVGGVRIYQVAEAYLGTVGAATNDGDYGKAFRDIAWLGQQVDTRWEAMTPEEKTKLCTKLATETLGSLAVGFGTLEEFLHGTQEKLGIICAEIPLQVAEIHVKDFMIRHSKLLGLNSNDITLIQELKNREIKKLEKLGYRWIDE